MTIQLFKLNLHKELFRPLWQRQEKLVDSISQKNLLVMTDDQIDTEAEKLADKQKILGEVPTLDTSKITKHAPSGGSIIETHVPFTGDAKFFNYEPRQMSDTPLLANRVTADTLIFDSREQSDANIDRTIPHIEFALNKLREDVNGFNDGYPPGGEIGGISLKQQFLQRLKKKQDDLKSLAKRGITID